VCDEVGQRQVAGEVWSTAHDVECELTAGSRPLEQRRAMLAHAVDCETVYSLPFYGRTLSDASMLYFADVFFLIFFYARISWRNG